MLLPPTCEGSTLKWPQGWSGIVAATASMVDAVDADGTDGNVLKVNMVGAFLC